MIVGASVTVSSSLIQAERERENERGREVD
jgi:hypothetical protein